MNPALFHPRSCSFAYPPTEHITAADLAFFWSAPWSVPLRRACRWLAPEAQTHVSPETIASRWLRPLCVQRWVGQAICARLAWMQAHTEAAFYRYSGSSETGCDESMPCWGTMATVPYARESLRELSDTSLLRWWGVEVERLLRIGEAPPSLLGDDWTRAALGVCEHLGQLYGELKRRHRAKRARELIREALDSYVVWDYRLAA